MAGEERIHKTRRLSPRRRTRTVSESRSEPESRVAQDVDIAVANSLSSLTPTQLQQPEPPTSWSPVNGSDDALALSLARDEQLLAPLNVVDPEGAAKHKMLFGLDNVCSPQELIATQELAGQQSEAPPPQTSRFSAYANADFTQVPDLCKRESSPTTGISLQYDQVIMLLHYCRISISPRIFCHLGALYRFMC